MASLSDSIKKSSVEEKKEHPIEVSAIEIAKHPKQKKIVLLIKREITQDEADQLEKVLDVTFLNDRVHLERRITDLLGLCELLVVPVYKENVKFWFEANEKVIDRDHVDIVLLERKSYKVSDGNEFKVNFVRKVLPVDQSKDNYLFNLLSNHISKVEPRYKRVLKAFLCCLRAVA